MTIEVNRVSKAFGSVVALSDVTVSIPSGVTALLGPNGAGKSTLFRVIAGLTTPSIGSVTVLGRSLRNDRAVRAEVSLVPQQDAMFEALSAAEFVSLAAKLSGVSAPDTATQRALTAVDLHDLDGRPVRVMSKGMRQRVRIAAAIVNDPSVIILDEPLNGLDPLQRERMIQLFRSLGDRGATVLISSHVLSEVAEIGSNVIIIAQGRLAAVGDYRQLRTMMDDRPQLVKVSTDRPAEFASIIIREQFATGVSVTADSLVLQTHRIDPLRRHIASLAREHDLALFGVENLDDNLDAVFAYLTAPAAGAAT